MYKDRPDAASTRPACASRGRLPDAPIVPLGRALANCQVLVFDERSTRWRQA